MNIEIIPTLSTNYSYAIPGLTGDIIVDPGESSPVLTSLKKRGRTCSAIVITHIDYDHIGGVSELVSTFQCPVYTPQAFTGISHVTTTSGNKCYPIDGREFEALATHGHTSIHMSYLVKSERVCFCGDALFACGCGRVRPGGNAENLGLSVQKISQLEPSIQLYSGHEYTIENIEFALQFDRDNEQLQQRQRDVAELRKKGVPSVPSTVEEECLTNPFIRILDSTSPVRQRAGVAQNATPIEAFVTLRKLKDQF